VVEESTEFIGIAGLDHKMLFLNRGGQAVVGVAGPSEVAGTTILDFLHPEDREEAEKFLARVRSESHCEGEFRLRNFRTGEPMAVSANVFLLRDRRTREPIAVAMVAHDLTEQKRTSELRERLLGIVGHDLRNPLTAIQMGSEVIRYAPESRGLQIKAAERIQASARRMERIIRDLLDLTKVRLGGGIEVAPRWTDAHQLCERIVEELRMAHPGREISLATSGDGHGNWDADRLEQVVSNLIANAVQYGPDDKAVLVESSGGDAEWTLSVQNFGELISAEVLPRIFDPFKQGSVSRARRGNLGLGLFIVHELVLAHQGTIEVSSTSGDGTRFVVRLPNQRLLS
jgi:PAS domain S-box-containing protein